MKYLVTLDRNSVVGATYANGNNDGYCTDGDINHPVLDCLEVDLTGYFAYLKRDLSRQGKAFQGVHIPHSAIAFVLSYAVGEPRPIGFTTTIELEA